MTLLKQTFRRYAALLVGVSLIVSLAGCGAGRISQTGTKTPSVNGSLVQVDDIFIQNVAITLPGSKEKSAADNSSSTEQESTPAELSFTISMDGIATTESRSVTVTSVTVNGKRMTFDPKKLPIVTPEKALVVSPTMPAHLDNVEWVKSPILIEHPAIGENATVAFKFSRSKTKNYTNTKPTAEIPVGVVAEDLSSQ